MPKENDLLEECRGWAVSVGCRVIKIHGSVWMEKGLPDIILCAPPHGKFVGCELKRKGERPTELQLLQLDRIRQAGGAAFWCDNFDDFRDKIREIIGG